MRYGRKSKRVSTLADVDWRLNYGTYATMTKMYCESILKMSRWLRSIGWALGELSNGRSAPLFEYSILHQSEL